jgi:hypothetical protein
MDAQNLCHQLLCNQGIEVMITVRDGSDSLAPYFERIRM